MVEGGGLLNRYTAQKLYPGFESLPHRQTSLAVRASFVQAGEHTQSAKSVAPEPAKRATADTE